MPVVYLAIGSNLGNKHKNIANSLNLIKEKCTILKTSSFYKTKPEGYKNQPDFLNCAVKINTTLKPQALLELLQKIEHKLKRVRKIKNGPRTIDLDILFYGKQIIKQHNLIIPHPRLHTRTFVLQPLNELSPKLIHPVLKISINKIMEKILST